MAGKKFLVTFCCFLLLPSQIAVPATQAEKTTELADARALIQAGKLEEAIALLKEVASREPEPKGVERELGMANISRIVTLYHSQSKLAFGQKQKFLPYGSLGEAADKIEEGIRNGELPA